MPVLFCDLETFSPVDLKSCGTHAYAEQAEILLFAYAVDDGPVRVLDFTQGDQPPAELYDESYMTVWHNSHFDRTVMNHALGYYLPLERTHDTMVRAMSHGLPGALGKLCDIVGVDTDKAKDKRGKQLIQLFCKPRPKKQKLRRATRATHPVEWAQFVEYARLDIEAMRELYKKLPLWNYKGKEKELWHLDQIINERGFAVDLDLARAAVEAINQAQAELACQTNILTGGAVQAATQRDALLAHILEAYGIEMPDMTSSTVDNMLLDDRLPPGVRELLMIRTQASASSTSKYKKLIKATSKDSRLRGTLQFAGAGRTLRWAGRTFQPQNLPRPNMKNKAIELGISALKYGVADLLYDNVMEVTSNCIRGCIVAPEGRKLVVSDLSNIEGRFAAWLAGEAWKLDAFRAYDTFILDKDGNKIPDGKGDFLRVGPDMYLLAYAKSFGVDVKSVTKAQRQVGKVQELALQYGGGVGAFLAFALLYRIDLNDLADAAWDAIPQRIKEEAAGLWSYSVKNKRTLGLSERVYVVCDSLKRMWREAHPAITSYWDTLGGAVRSAMLNPGTVQKARSVRCQKNGAWLRVLLPSGLYLCYPGARLEDRGVSYMGVNQYTRQWSRIESYGPKLFENAVQAGAREVLADNMLRIEKAGYPLILSVHDELLTEPLDLPEYNVAELSRFMSTVPPWAEGLPLAAAGFEGYRYKKE